jgi:ATP-dependent RNA helicase DeaD
MKSEAFSLSKQMIGLLEAEGITEATPVQKEIIPAIVAGRDVLAQSETGSGKTLSFAIPIIEQLNRRDGLRALILVPTRELCTQITGEFVKYSHGKHLGITPVYGGVSISNQIKSLKTTNIIIATPGRLLDLLSRRAVQLESVNFLVFDEADRMLDMGFIKDIERILHHLPAKRQTMLFSATVSKEIERLSQKYLHNPKHVRLASSVKPEFLHQTYYQTTSEQKMDLLIELLKRERDLALVFCNRKHVTTKLARKLSTEGINAKCLNGNMSQPQRERVTNEFRHKRFTVLVATDVAARGLHIEDISHVYNFEIPKDVESYTHRVGRTARAGKQGEAISLVASGEEKKFFQNILFSYRGSITLKSPIDVPRSAISRSAAPRSAAPHAQAASPERKKKGSKPWKKKWQGFMSH